jgi:hypothetical protein
MQPKWVIEHIFDDDVRNIVDSLEANNVEHKIVSDPIYDGKWKDLYGPKDCVITYGSIQFGNMVHRQSPWVPGHYGTFQNYLCSVYYPYFGDHMLNSHYMYLPFSTLLDKKYFIFDTMGEEDTVFIRPDSGNKTFTGKAVYKERFKREVELFGFYDTPRETMCLISTPKNIVEEWRFFIVDDEVVCGSTYKKSRHAVAPHNPFRMIDCVTDDDQAAMKAHNVLGELKWQPDRVWCMDICKTKEGNFYVLEIGSFASAGLYDCETTELVRKINRVAVDEWSEYYAD